MDAPRPILSRKFSHSSAIENNSRSILKLPSSRYQKPFLVLHQSSNRSSFQYSFFSTDINEINSLFLSFLHHLKLAMIVKHNGVIMELLKFAGKPKPTNIQLSVEIYMHNQSLGMITGDNWEPHKSFEH